MVYSYNYSLTATSATTVTCLSVFNINTTLILFGELIVLFLIQIGGVGFMTFAVAMLMILERKVGMKNRIFIQESFAGNSAVILILSSLFVKESYRYSYDQVQTD